MLTPCRHRRTADRPTLPMLVLAVLVLLVPLAGAANAAAQGSWVRTAEGERSFGVEFQKPSFEGDDFTFFTSVLNLSGEFPVGEGITVELELPFVHAGVDSELASSSSQTLGNPYVGVAVYRDDGNGSFRVGARLPLAREFGDDDFATGVGILSDQDRMERFPPDLLSVLALGEYRTPAEETEVSFAFQGGASVMTPTEGPGDTEGFLLYGMSIEGPLEDVRIGAGFTGRMIVTESDLDFGERTIHHVAVTGRLDRGRVRPALQLRVPVDDDLGEVLSFVLGFGLEVRVP